MISNTILLFSILTNFTSCNGQDKTHLPKGNSVDPYLVETQDTISTHGPRNITRNMLQDKNGNFWFATWEGIIRYDGKSFTNITSKVSSARFFSVLEDRKGNLWFGSIGSGVYYYQGESFQNFTTKDGLVNDEISCIYEDKTGNIWFGVNGGASRYDGKLFRNYMMNGDFMTEDNTGKTFPNFTRPPNEVTSIIEDKTGKLWFGTRGNTFVYDGKTFTVFTNNGKPFTNVRSIIEDKEGNIWLGGNDGLWRYDGTTFTSFTTNFVGYIYEDKKGNIWTGSEGATPRNWLLSRYNENTLSNEQTEPNIIKKQDGQIFGILEDTNGNIWFGTENGVCRYDGKSFTNFTD